jgi:mono/diheme cytochrome c family protein
MLVACTATTETGKVIKANLQPIGIEEARSIYLLNCASCHGEDGKLGASGAKDLSKSSATDAFILQTISEGNDKGMMPYNQILEKRQILGLVKFVQTLRTTK